MGTVHYLNTRMSADYHQRRLRDFKGQASVIAYRLEIYTAAASRYFKAGNELDKYKGKWGWLKRLLQPERYAIAEAIYAQAESQHNAAFEQFIRAKDELKKKGHIA